MTTRKRLTLAFAGMCIFAILYIAGYLHFVHPMPTRVPGSERETVEPVFQTARPGIINYFRIGVPIDQVLFPSRWELAHFQLPPTNLAGLRAMRPFQARVESISRTTPHDTGISALHMGLRLNSGHFLMINQPAATEPMFSLAGALQDAHLHEFPGRWVDSTMTQ